MTDYSDDYKKGYKDGYARAREELISSSRRRFIADIEKDGLIVKGDEIFEKTEYGFLRLVGYL